MKKQTIFIIVIGVLIAGAIAWYLISPLFKVIEVNEAIPVDDGLVIETSPLIEGTFVASAHSVMGQAYVFKDSNGKSYLRFQDFETVNGPNLHIYLATDTSAEDYVDLGDIRATKGNVNYELPDDLDFEKYDTVLVWCVPFRVLFSYAELN